MHLTTRKTLSLLGHIKKADSITVLKSLIEPVLGSSVGQGRIYRGAKGAIAPGPPARGGPLLYKNIGLIRCVGYRPICD